MKTVIRVTSPEKSAEVQEVLFKQGYEWQSRHRVQINTFKKYLFLNISMKLTYCDTLHYAHYSVVENEAFIFLHKLDK